eukprot:SAG31_NODE_3333_length_4395_cov_2.924814_4_plen_101_part_00
METNPYDLGIAALRAKLLADALRKEKTALLQTIGTQTVDRTQGEIGLGSKPLSPVSISQEVAMQSILYSRDYAWGQESKGELLVYDEELDDWAPAKVVTT